MIKLKKIGAAICVVATICTISGCDQTKSINMNVKEGDKYIVYVSTNANTSMKVAGQAVNSKQEMDMSYDVDITDVDKNSNITMDYKYDSIKTDTEAMGQTLSYDSKNTNDSSSEQGKIYGGLIGKSFSVKVSNKGKILEIKGVDDILSSVVDKITTDDSQKQKIKDTLSKSFGDDAIKSALQQSMNYYPDKKVNIGDTWENKYNLNIMCPMSIDSKYKLLNADNNQYAVGVNSNLSADTKGQSVDIMGVKAKLKLNGNMTGNINVNKDNGFLSNGTETETVKGTMDMLPNNLIPTEISLPMTVTETITYKTVKK
jgi:hypothetical protein